VRIDPVGTPGGVFAYLRAQRLLLPRVIRTQSCGRALPPKATLRDIFSLFGRFSLNHVTGGRPGNKMVIGGAVSLTAATLVVFIPLETNRS